MGPPPYGYGGPPMSPMPMGYHPQHPHMQSPGGFGSPPGMYPSPQHHAVGGGSGRPGGPPGTPQGGMPYMPPRDTYDPTQSPSNAYHQNSAGGGGGEGAPVDGGPGTGGRGEQVNMSDVSHLLMY